MNIPHVTSNVLIFDIGKTHIKLNLVDEEQCVIWKKKTNIQVSSSGPYPHVDIESIWQWFTAQCRIITQEHHVSDIVIATHGATCALVDPARQSDGLALPIMDYEFKGVETLNGEYDNIRPNFNESLSPSLPAGLNLGRQLYWQQKNFPEEFKRAKYLLFYPQYWAWRLSGKMASEITSLGCHTDLWNAQDGEFSSLTKRMKWQALFPPIQPAWGELGRPTYPVREITGLSERCRILVGIHDSNAGYFNHINDDELDEFTLISTGTWTVSMQSMGDLSHLDETKDMLANCDVYGNPIPCARFMGGREYATICKLTETDLNQTITVEDIQNLINRKIFALPNFGEGSGPFGQREPAIIGGPVENGAALATLYSALMMHHEMNLLKAKGVIIIEGSFTNNTLLCQLFTQLRGKQKVYISQSDSDIVQGCLKLAHTGQEFSGTNKTICAPLTLNNLDDYCKNWNVRVGISNSTY